MKILFVSKLMAKAAAGPNWSVPARIKAQSKFDQIYWINADKSEMPHWRETGLFHKVDEFGGKLRIENLPADFGRPEAVVFEVPYFLEYLGLASQLREQGIPYIIVPRCSFTHQAMNNHAKWKKRIAGWLMFNRFFKGASAIQYLTRQEYEDSSPFMCENHFIVPNGIEMPERLTRVYTEDKPLRGLFIGRIDIYHKGLDLMLEAVAECKDFLRDKHITIDIWGPENPDFHTLRKLAAEKEIEDLFNLKGEISGERKKKALEEADFFIMTSRFEGLPMAMLEALSYGLPCIATDGTYLREEIDRTSSGLGCGNSTDEIINVLLQLGRNKSALNKMSQNALCLANEYAWDEQARKFHEQIKNIVNKV